MYATDYAPMFTAVMIATILRITPFAILNKRVLVGMTEGAVKG